MSILDYHPFALIWNAGLNRWVGGLTPSERNDLLAQQQAITDRQAAEGLSRDRINQQQGIISAVRNAPTPNEILAQEAQRTYEDWAFWTYGGDLSVFGGSFVEEVSNRIPTVPQVTDFTTQLKWLAIAGLAIYGLTLVSPAVKKYAKRI